MCASDNFPDDSECGRCHFEDRGDYPCCSSCYTDSEKVLEIGGTVSRLDVKNEVVKGRSNVEAKDNVILDTCKEYKFEDNKNVIEVMNDTNLNTSCDNS